MHFTLSVRSSLITQAVAAGTLIAMGLLLDLAHPVIWIPIALFEGALSGWLRSRAIRQSSFADLRAANSTLAVARILEATSAGRWSLWLTWAALAIALVLVIAGLPFINWDAVMAMCAASLLAHEIVCLPTLWVLNKPMSAS